MYVIPPIIKQPSFTDPFPWQHFRSSEDKGFDHDHPNPDAIQEISSPSTLRPLILGSRYEPTNGTPVRAPSPYAPIIDPIIPPINAYGTFDPHIQHPQAPSRPVSRQSDISQTTSEESESRPLLPSELRTEEPGFMSRVSRDLIPFESIFSFIHRIFKRTPKLELPTNGTVQVRYSHFFHPCEAQWAHTTQQGIGADSGQRKVAELSQAKKEMANGKHRPKIAGGGQNLPLAILRCLSEWVSVLDDRMTMNGLCFSKQCQIICPDYFYHCSGNAGAGLYTYISNFEDNLSCK